MQGQARAVHEIFSSTLPLHTQAQRQALHTQAPPSMQLRGARSEGPPDLRGSSRPGRACLVRIRLRLRLRVGVGVRVRVGARVGVRVRVRVGVGVRVRVRGGGG